MVRFHKYSKPLRSDYRFINEDNKRRQSIKILSSGKEVKNASKIKKLTLSEKREIKRLEAAHTDDFALLQDEKRELELQQARMEAEMGYNNLLEAAHADDFALLEEKEMKLEQRKEEMEAEMMHNNELEAAHKDDFTLLEDKERELEIQKARMEAEIKSKKVEENINNQLDEELKEKRAIVGKYLDEEMSKMSNSSIVDSIKQYGPEAEEMYAKIQNNPDLSPNAKKFLSLNLFLDFSSKFKNENQ